MIVEGMLFPLPPTLANSGSKSSTHTHTAQPPNMDTCLGIVIVSKPHVAPLTILCWLDHHILSKVIHTDNDVADTDASCTLLPCTAITPHSLVDFVTIRTWPQSGDVPSGGGFPPNDVAIPCLAKLVVCIRPDQVSAGQIRIGAQDLVLFEGAVGHRSTIDPKVATFEKSPHALTSGCFISVIASLT
jgi:hypothetical protein